MKGGRRQGRQKERWKDNIRECTGLEFGRSQRAVENRELEETGCKIIRGASTTLAVKGLMMMMMMVWVILNNYNIVPPSLFGSGQNHQFEYSATIM